MNVCSQILLPESAVRRSSPEFEEYTIPAPPRQCPVPQERYVPVSELDGVCARTTLLKLRFPKAPFECTFLLITLFEIEI